MSIYDKLDGGQFAVPYYDMGEEHGGLPEHQYKSTGTQKGYTSNMTTNSGGAEQTSSVTRNEREHAPVYEQRFIQTQRNADLSPYIAMVSRDPATGLVDPTQDKKSALRAARIGAFARLAGNLGRMAASDAAGVTGPISRDTQNPLYLSSMASYRNAIPAYNKAVATARAAQIKAQADLAKAQANTEMRYDLQDAKGANMAEHTTTNAYNTEAENYANRNAVKTLGSNKSYSKGSTTNRTDTTNSATNTSVWQNEKKTGGKNGAGEFSELQLTTPYKIRSKDGTEVAATAAVNGDDFATLLSKISALSNPNIVPSGLPGSRAEQQKLREMASKWQGVFKRYYDAYGINQNKDAITGEKTYNVYSLSPMQLKNMFNEIGTSFLKDINTYGDYFGAELGKIKMYNDNNPTGTGAQAFFNPAAGNVGIRQLPIYRPQQ